MDKDKLYSMIRSVRDTFFESGTVGRPQNMAKNSKPARMLKGIGASADDLIWFYDMSGGRPSYRGCLVSKRIVKNKAVKDWASSLPCSEPVEGSKYILYKFDA